MIRKTLIVTCAALALAGGCKKKDKEPGAGSGSAKPGSGSMANPGSGSGGVATPGSGSMAAPAPLTGEKLAQAFIDHWGAWNAGDRAKFEGNYDANAVGHRPDSPMGDQKGPAAMANEAFMFRAGFPDGKGSPQLVLVNGRTVVGTVLLTGTNTTAMKTPDGEMPPTNKKVGIVVFHAVTFNDANKIAEDWWIWDGATFASQAGMMPKPMGRPVMEKGADAPTIVVSAGGDTEKANLATAAKGNEDFNKHDVAAMMAMWADDGVETDMSSPADMVGKAAIEPGTKMFIGAFPDGKITPNMALAAGDYVVQVSTFTGTNTGDMAGDKATGKSAKLTVAEILHMQAGKVKHLWRFYDGYAMAMQMGWMPAPGDPAAKPADPAAKPADPVAKPKGT